MMQTCICGKTIEAHPGKGRPARFCSETCRVRAHRARRANNVTPDVTQMTPRSRPVIAPFPWFGGKQYLVGDLLRLLPEHRVYCEVFGGAGSLLFSKPPARHEIYNDLDSGLVTFFRVLRDQGLELKALLDLTPCGREEYLLCRNGWQDATTELEQARRWYVMVAQGFSAHVGSKSGWSYSKERNVAREYRQLVEALPGFIERLKQVQIEHLDFAQLIANYDTPATLFYCDPPYVPDTRSSGGYRHEMTQDDHVRLLEAITRAQGKIILSGYRCDLYDRALDGWERIDKPTFNWASNTEREKRVECIWLSPNIRRQPSLWEEVS